MAMNTLTDPAQFAQAVRGLAYDARRTLARSPSPKALRRLARRVEGLSSALGDRSGGPLRAWLESLGREVRTAAVHQDESSRPTCICA